ncbi:MAG: pitrilysin family protein [Candidatus Liptonbacteria bacterium]
MRLIKHVYANGLRLLMVPQAQNLAVTVLVIVKAGSEYETREINGLSHFLEHMVFKGTARRPKPGDISRELEAMGAEYNAFTGRELTMYYAKSEKGNLNRILDLVTDMYLNPLLDGAEIEKEKGVIIEEINLYEDTPARKVHDLFSRLMYGDQPAGWDVAGTRKAVGSLKREDFLEYRKRHYVPGETVVAIAGAFSPARIKREIGKTFGVLAPGRTVRKRKTIHNQETSRLQLSFKESKQSHLVLGFPTCDVFDRRRHTLRVLAEVLGGGMSSRLFAKIREEMGAAYYVRAEEDFLTDHGHFAISSGVEIGKIEAVLREIIKELARIKNELVSLGELKKAKGHLLGNLMLGLETSDDLAGFYGGQEAITGRPLSPMETARNIKKVTSEQIRAVARDFFRKDKLNLAVIGPHRKEAPFRKILRGLT